MRYVIVFLVLLLFFYLGFRVGKGKHEIKTEFIVDSSYIISANAIKNENETLKGIAKLKDSQINALKKRKTTINKVYKDTIIAILDTIIYEYSSKDSISELRLAKLDTLVTLKDEEIERIVKVNDFVLDIKNRLIDSLKIANKGLEKKIKRKKVINRVTTILKIGLGIFIGSKL